MEKKVVRESLGDGGLELTLVIFFAEVLAEARTPKHEKSSHVCLGTPTAQNSVIGIVLHVFYEDPCGSMDGYCPAEAPRSLGYAVGGISEGETPIPASQESPTMTLRARKKSPS